MRKFRIFISSVQSEFVVERVSLAEYVRTESCSSRSNQGSVGAQWPQEKCLILLAGSELKRQEIAVGVRMPNSCGFRVCGSGSRQGWRGQRIAERSTAEWLG